jgi:hypothetical protein
MDHAVQQAAGPVHTKAALLQEARPLPEQDLKRFREPTDEALRIKPDDPWNVLVLPATVNGTDCVTVGVAHLSS